MKPKLKDGDEVECSKCMKWNGMVSNTRYKMIVQMIN